MAGLSLGLMLVGGRLEYPELVALGASGVIALPAGVLWTRRAPATVITRSLSLTRVAQGEKVTATVTVINDGRAWCPPARGLEAVGAQSAVFDVDGVRSGRSFTTVYFLPTSRRGVYELGPITLVRSDPLHLTEARWRQAAGEAWLTVHPQIHEMAPVRLWGNAGQAGGALSTSSTADTIDLQSLREYVPGDDPRLIHWRATARSDVPIVRYGVEQPSRRATIVLDVVGDFYSGVEFEDAVRFAASLCVAMYGADRSVTLRTTCREHEAMEVVPRSNSSVNEVLDFLAGVDTVADDGLAFGRRSPRRDRGGGGLAVMVTGASADPKLVPRRSYGRVYVVRLGREEDVVTLFPGCVVVDSGSSVDAVRSWNELMT